MNMISLINIINCIPSGARQPDDDGARGDVSGLLARLGDARGRVDYRRNQGTVGGGLR